MSAQIPTICKECGFGYDAARWLECPAVHLDERQEIERGELLADVLGLKQEKDGRYKTTWGTKTALGLYRTVLRLINEGK